MYKLMFICVYTYLFDIHICVHTYMHVHTDCVELLLRVAECQMEQYIYNSKKKK